MGGQQPVSGATIQLFSVNASTDGGAATALLTSTVTTSDGTGLANANANAGNANNTLGAGFFDITGRYSCATPGTLVYLTASGGNPGLGGSVNNAAIQTIAAIGTCSSLQSTPFLNINEVTTVGAIGALYPYTTAYNQIGAANQTNLATAFNVANEYVSLANGMAPGPALPSNYSADTPDVNALANIVAT